MNIVTVEESRNNIVKKQQDLIHNARYKLSELGIKTIAILISQIKVSDEDFKEYALKIDDIKRLAGDSKTKNTKHYVEVVTEDLMSKPFWIKNERFNWVSYARWEEGSNIIFFEVHRKLKPYFLEMQKNFLQYNITNILPLKSGYVIRLYELCKDHYAEQTRYKPNKKTVQFELKIDKMRELFEIPISYQYSSHIKKHILDKAIKQFKEKTDIQISYKEQKIGRKVDRIIITVRENNKGSNDYLNDIHKFIRHIRRHHINDVLIETTDKYTQQKIKLSVDPDGKLYNQRDHTPIPADRSMEMWNTLYDLAKADNLPCLKQGFLIDEQTPTIETTTSQEKPKKKSKQEKNPNVTALKDIEHWKLRGVAMGFKGWVAETDAEYDKEIFKFITYNKDKHGEDAVKDWIALFNVWLLNKKEMFALNDYGEN